MEAFLIRHAIAEPFSPSGTDADRALSSKGRQRFARAVAALGHSGLRLGTVVHSPLLRAVQTAELLAPLVDGDCGASDLLARAPGEATCELLAGSPTDSTALVGHEPWMSELLALLCFGDLRRSWGLRFSKGAVAWLEGDPEPGGMQLRALWPAKALAALAPGS